MATGFGGNEGQGEHHQGAPQQPSLFQKLNQTQALREVSFSEVFSNLNSAWLIAGQSHHPQIFTTASNSENDHFASSSVTADQIQGYLPPIPPTALGSSEFIQDHQLKQAYVGGSMANGIASTELVSALAHQGNLAFYGAAGQTPDRVIKALEELEQRNPGGSWGCNLIHSPSEPTIESEVARILGSRKVRHVEASAYLDLTEPLVKLRIQSLQRDVNGKVTPQISIMAKASRLEVAKRFLSPAPEEWVRSFLERGEITADQAQWAREWPICDDLTAEADSGGHTDNRPLSTLVPAFCDLRDNIAVNLPRARQVRVGAAGGLGTPSAIASAFALGAGYVVVGSVHQACVESGTSPVVKDLLAQAGPADVIMAPASDMFEMGVHLQVLRRGTMFGTRARRLLDLYRSHQSIDEIPVNDRARIEKEIFRMPLEEVWNHTRNFFLEREPAQVERAESDSHHRMALIFRWYLGKSSDWANSGNPERALDYQVWCGPAMGAFNEWVQGSILENAGERRVATVAHALMYGAAVRTRAQDITRYGYQIPSGSWFDPVLPNLGNQPYPMNFNDTVRNSS